MSRSSHQVSLQIFTEMHFFKNLLLDESIGCYCEQVAVSCAVIRLFIAQPRIWLKRQSWAVALYRRRHALYLHTCNWHSSCICCILPALSAKRISGNSRQISQDKIWCEWCLLVQSPPPSKHNLPFLWSVNQSHDSVLHVHWRVCMTLLRCNSIWIQLKNHLMRASKPFHDVIDVFLSSCATISSLSNNI